MVVALKKITNWLVGPQILKTLNDENQYNGKFIEANWLVIKGIILSERQRAHPLIVFF